MQKYIANTYEVIAQIGMGNSGIVYKARHRNLDKFVVLKKIKANAINIADNRAEADVLKNLKHAYLPQVMDFVEDNGDNLFIAVSFLLGYEMLSLISCFLFLMFLMFLVSYVSCFLCFLFLMFPVSSVSCFLCFLFLPFLVS